MKTSSRLTLIGGVSVLALSAGLAGAARAQSTAIIDIDFTVPAGTSILTMTADVDTPVLIIDKQSVLDGSDVDDLTDDTDIFNFAIVGDNVVADEPSNLVFSEARANLSDSSIGLSSVSGAMIEVGQEVLRNDALTTSASAITNDTLLVMALLGAGQNVTGTVNTNQVTAEASFNAAFGTIETTIPANLDDASPQGRYNSDLLAPIFSASIFPTEVDQRANYNITTVQVASGYANGNAADDLTTSSVDDTTILLARSTFVDGSTVSGGFAVNGNVVSGQTNGNAADSSIILRSGEANTFGGTAYVSATQVSRDTVTAGIAAISASNEDTNIVAAFAAILVGPPFLVTAEDLDVSVAGNRVTSNASINSAINLLAFDGDLNLAGASPDTGISTGSGGSLGDGNSVVRSDYGVVNNQTSGNAPLVQRSRSFTEDALILFTIEDIDLDSHIAVDGNTIGASASGNLGTNIIRNHDDADDGIPDLDLANATASVLGTFASANRQFIISYGVSAQVFESTIAAGVGTENDGATPFGGISGDSSLSVDGNLFSASATANGATASVDIAGSSIVSESDADDLGARIVSERNSGSPQNVQQTNGGVNLSNWQFADNFGNGFVADTIARLEGNSVQVLINYDDGTVGTEDSPLPEVADATISASGNGFVAAATMSGYNGTASLESATSIEASIAALSFQSNGVALGDGRHVVSSEIVDGVDLDSGISAILGLTLTAENVTLRLDGNSVLSLANGNDSAQALTASAGTTITTEAGLLGSGRNAEVRDDVTAVLAETVLTTIDAAGGLLAVSDQTLRHAEVESSIDDFAIELILADPGGADAATLSNAVLSMADNRLVSQALGNTATNAIDLQAGTAINATAGQETGAIAGIASSQSTPQLTEVSPAGFFEADLLNNEVVVEVLAGGTSDPVAVTNTTVNVGDGGDADSLGNVLQAVAFANRVDNTITTSSLTLDTNNATGSLATAENVGAEDYRIGAEDASLYILNRQRNEGLETAVEPGPRVEAFAESNIIIVNFDGGTGVVDSTVAIGALGTPTTASQPNIIQATAAANVATNAIAVNPGETVGASVTADASAIVNSRQGNSGNVGADNEDSVIEANLLGAEDAAHSNVTLNVDGNVIGSSATGNSATNAILAQAGTTLNGTNGGGLGGAFIGAAADDPGGTIASIHSETGSFDTNSDAFVNGNLAVLNTQRNYGVGDFFGPSLINAETENAEFTLNVVGSDVTTTNAKLSLSGNNALSQAAANVATNSISTVAATGSPDFISALNNQAAASTQVTSAVTDTSVALNVDGDFDGGSVAVNSNSVVASADLNSASNSLTSVSGVGGLPSATIVNHQVSTDSSASSSVTGTTISSTNGIFGGSVSNATVSVSGNQVGTSTTINNATNTIGAPGQTFTRTSSF
jgi:hypothetical protein